MNESKHTTEWDIARKSLADIGFTPEESSRTFAELACEANPLFAAAPELLEALGNIARMFPSTEAYSGMEAHDRVEFRWTEIRSFVDAARAAIAKAEGR